MALSLDVNRLMEEREAQAKARDQILAGAEDLLRRYPGPWWKNHPGPDAQFDPENGCFEYVSYSMSQKVWDNPRWKVGTRRPRAQGMVAEALQHGMNRWTKDSDFKTVLEDLSVDADFCWAIGHVSPQPRLESYEAEDPVLWPQASRLDPWDVGFDDRCPTWRQARMWWHNYRVDKEDLVELARNDRKLPRREREGWDVRAIEKLAISSSSPSARWAIAGGNRSKRDVGQSPERDQVELVQVYLPGGRLPYGPGPEEGFNGLVLDIGVSARSSDGVIVRPPRPFFGPRWGPYSLIGSYIVPSCPFPLSLLMAAAGHIEQSSRIAKAIDREVERHKRFVATNNERMAAAVKSIQDGNVAYLDAATLEAAIMQLEFGGTNQHSLAAEARVNDRRNRIMGLDEVQRGVVNGEGTATEVQLAVEAALGRQGYIKGRFHDGVRRIGKTVAWYLFHTDEIVFPLGQEAAQDDQTEPWFLGGTFEDGSGATFDDLGLEIEPYSMERPTIAHMQQQASFLANLIQAVPMLVQAKEAGADVKALVDAWGESFGHPNASRFLPGIDDADPSMLQPAQAMPRLGRDVGRLGMMGSMGGWNANRGSANQLGGPQQRMASQGMGA